MRKFVAIIFLAVCSLGSHSFATDSLKIMNSYVSMKLHLSSSNGQMVGAAWIRVRNISDAPISEIPFLLNSGLNVSKITASNNNPLRETS